MQQYKPWSASAHDRFWHCLVLLVFVTASYIKAPQILFEPRFFAEEGTVYFSQFRSMRFLDAMLFVLNGNFLLLSNVLVYVATKVPLIHAPAVTTYASYLVSALVVILILKVVVGYRLHRSVAVLLTIAWALLPASYETWASATNLQWVCSVSMLLLLLLPVADLERNRLKSAIWTILCGMTGVPSTMLGPAFLLRARLDRSHFHLILGLTLCGCALVHLIVLHTLGVTQRPFSIGPRAISLPAVIQTVLTPVLGVEWVEYLARPIREGAGSILLLTGTYAIGTALALFAVVAAARARGIAAAILITTVWLLVSILNNYGGLGSPIERISPFFGSRYFLFGAMCFCLLLGMGTAALESALRLGSAALLTLVVVICVANRLTGNWFRSLVTGPSWTEEIKKCPISAERCEVAIWPEGWTVTLVPAR